MKIAILAPLWKKIPPEKYGGSELVVANLAKGLLALGHDVTTFACAGSSIAGKLVPVIPKPMHELIGGFDWSGIQPYEFLSYFELAARAKDFEIIHNHMGIHPIALSLLLPAPMVTTLHSSLPPDFPYLADAFCNYPFVSVSVAQRTLAPKLNYVATVHHGIDVNAFTARLEGAGKGFAFVGTLSRNKGVDIAIRTARALNMPLVIAGEMRECDREFINKEVFPFIDGKTIRFVGEIGHEEKNRLLGESDALLFPPRWNEAFGLVMIEALACGTPVVALGNGAVQEVLRDGLTGFVANTEKQFFEAAQKVQSISRNVCRAQAEQHFDLSIMAKKYVEVYQLLIANQ
ncbi:MAG: glycosyltransferase family 4 protein [Candidatus Azambacteria bacterium]|nr:glycosyltransferase family 4 protein [Candidatus Azambacteria bacterium]